MHRLESLSPQLMTLVGRLPPAARQEASLAACRQALEEVAPTSPVFADALLRLEAGAAIPDTPLAELRRATEAADEEYFVLQDEAENDPSKAPRALTKFSEARLGSAILAASGARTAEQTADAVYEALSARSDPAAAAIGLLLAFG